MTFKITASAAAVLTLCLAIGYLFAGDFMTWRWQIEPTASVLLYGRRIGASFLGLSVIFIMAPGPRLEGRMTKTHLTRYLIP